LSYKKRKDVVNAIVEDMTMRGYTKAQMADAVGISERSFDRWINQYKEIEEAIKSGNKKRKFIAMSTEINEEVYNLAENMVDILIEDFGEENINRDFQIGCQYTYLMNLLMNKE
jgi:transposase